VDINTGTLVNNNSAAYTQPVKASDAAGITNANAETKPESIFGEIKQQNKEYNEVAKDDINKTTDSLNKIIQLMNADLQFVLHDKTQRFMVQLVDIKEGKVLKEFPPHELLDTIAAIKDYVGLLLDKKA